MKGTFLKLSLPAFVAGLIAAGLVSCASYTKVGIGSGGRALGVWEQSGQARGVLLDGRNYYIITETGRPGPYDWVQSPEDLKGALDYAYSKDKKSFLTDGNDAAFGPYSYIGSGKKFRGAYSDAMLFICRNVSAGYDLFYDNNGKLKKLGTVADEFTSLFGAHVSPDGSHTAVMVTDTLRGKEGVLFDSTFIPLPSLGKYTHTVVGFVANTYWVLRSTAQNKMNLFMMTKRSDAAALPEIRMLLASGAGDVSGVSDGGANAEQIIRTQGYVRSDDGTSAALRYLTERGSYIYTGTRKFGPFRTSENTEKGDLKLSSDGKSVAYSYEDTGRKWFVGKDDSQYGPYDKAGYYYFIDGTKDLFYTATVEGKVWAFVNGKKISGPWDSADACQVNVLWGKAAGRDYPVKVFDGYYTVKAGGKTMLYRLGAQVFGPFDADGGRIYVSRTKEGDCFTFSGKGADKKDLTEVFDGKQNFRFTMSGFPVFSSDGKSSVYRFEMNSQAFIQNGAARLGPYDKCGTPQYVPGRNEFAYLYAKGGTCFLGWSGGASVEIPVMTIENGRWGSLKVSPDGQAAQITLANRVLDTSAGNDDHWLDRETDCVLIQGALHVGTYDPKTGVTIYWDEKDEKVKRIRGK